MSKGEDKQMKTKIYYCEHCHNMVLMINDSGVNPVCCGEKMKELVANTTDGALEKHVPEVSVNGREVHVKVGSVPHPMTEGHYIDFIILETNKGHHVHHLDHLKPAETIFALADDEEPINVYAYCNLHGLWVKQI